MSNPIRDCGEAHMSTGEMLNDFLYVDGKPRLGRKERTYEELWLMLEAVRVNSWSEWNDTKNAQGW